MNYFSLFLFGLSCLLLVLGHITRSYRWKMLFPAGIQKDRYSLILSLSIGYAFNFLLPFRIGELVRIFLLSWYWKIKSSQSAATVVTERFIDATCISILYFIFFKKPIIVSIFISVLPVFILSMTLIQYSKLFRFYIFFILKIFNRRIQSFLIDFLWSTAQLCFNIKLVSFNFIATTLTMWMLYFLSYFFLSQSTGITFNKIITIFFFNPLSSTYFESIRNWSHAQSLLILYVLIPIIILSLYSLLKIKTNHILIVKSKEMIFPTSSNTISTYFHHNFTATSDYENFLFSLFNTNAYSMRNFGLHAIGDAKVHKVFNGGSGAITALVENQSGLFIRKFVNSNGQAKLQAQFQWLIKHKGFDFPLVDVIKEEFTANGYYYDMILKSPSIDFYEFIHNNPIEDSKILLLDICKKLLEFHQNHQQDDATSTIIYEFHYQKVIYNINIIKSYFSEIFDNGFIDINNERYTFDSWNSLLKFDWFSNQLYNFRTSVIHGDFTIENIIISYANDISWFAIDPNPDNIFNSPLIDWSKLMQSLDMGYERLNKGIPYEFSDFSLRIDLDCSEHYQALHLAYCKFIVDNYGHDFLKAIYFHEIICYLRMLPYKIQQQNSDAIVFFACLCKLIRNYHLLDLTNSERVIS